LHLIFETRIGALRLAVTFEQAAHWLPCLKLTSLMITTHLITCPNPGSEM
jgi:hypothetical protein